MEKENEVIFQIRQKVSALKVNECYEKIFNDCSSCKYTRLSKEETSKEIVKEPSHYESRPALNYNFTCEVCLAKPKLIFRDDESTMCYYTYICETCCIKFNYQVYDQYNS